MNILRRTPIRCNSELLKSRFICTTLPPQQSSDSDRKHAHRTRLTNLLWRERYAIGMVNKAGVQVGSSIPSDTRPYNPSEKRMSESYCQVILPFRTDLHLREEYVNTFRGLRLGKILEDLDALAASIAYKHCHDGRSADLPPLTIVTASMDRMDLLNPLRPDLDLKLYGHVTYVGRSSMEVTIRVESLGDPKSLDPIDDSGEQIHLTQSPKWTPICLCKFTLVARDPSTHASAQVPTLNLTTAAEKRLFALGAESKKHKLEAARTDLSKQPPTPEERLLIHALYLEYQKYTDAKGDLNPALVPKNVTFEQDTRHQIVKICHPQERNIHSSIFGGFLMREAFELGYAVAMLYIKGRPWTVALDDIAFRKPVPIGSILHLTSQVEYAEGEPHATFQVSVTAEVISDIATGVKQVTNIFYFTFARGKEPGVQVRKMLPRTYGESMQYLQGKRRKERGQFYKKAQLDEFLSFSLADVPDEDDGVIRK